MTGPSARFTPPEGARISPATGDLEQMLLDGEVDAFFSARVKERERSPAERRIRPLLADPRAREAAFGIPPIIHTVVLSRALLDSQPEAARLVFDAYGAAKTRALQRRLGASFMPWAEQSWDTALDCLGQDPMPYGPTPGNRQMLAAMAGYLAEQGLVDVPQTDIDALFHPGSAGWTAG